MSVEIANTFVESSSHGERKKLVFIVFTLIVHGKARKEILGEQVLNCTVISESQFMRKKLF